MSSEPLSQTASSRIGTPPWLKVLIVLHMVAITVWTLPVPPTAVASGKVPPRGSDWLLLMNARYLRPMKPLQAYLLTTGFWQFWDMFAPNPADTDFYGDAVVVYRDGTQARYQYPRMYLLPIDQKYQKERYRKFYERAHLESNTYLWPRFAQRIAFLMTKSLANPPVTVRLSRHWLPIAAPGKKQQATYNSYQYYEYAVDEDLLKKEYQGFL